MTATCAACGRGQIEGIYELEAVPARSSAVFPSAAEARACPRGDLRLAVCLDCGFIHNVSFDAGLVNYGSGYEGGQSASPAFRVFQKELARSLISRHRLTTKPVIDIGCGGGDFLAVLCELAGAEGIGIDPSADLSRLPSPMATRLSTIREPYSEHHREVNASLITCRHTIEHISAVARFAGLLHKHSVRTGAPVFLEVPDSRPHLESGMFWEIGYEHCSYFTAGSLSRLLRGVGFRHLAVERLHGGQYLALEASPAGGPPSLPDSEDTPPQTAALARAFRGRVAVSLEWWRHRLALSRRWICWGSGSKFVWFTSGLGLEGICEFVVDINLHRHGKFTPGGGSLIVPPAFLREYRPDAVVVLNPAYRIEIGEHVAGLDLKCEILTP